jgi:hypothetical protein
VTRVVNWFRGRHRLIAELHNLDRAVRELMNRQYANDVAWDQFERAHDGLRADLVAAQTRCSQQDVLLSALGAVELSKADADG